MLLKSIFRRYSPEVWNRYNYLSYLFNLNPILEGTKTLLLDEYVSRQPDRPTLYNRVLLGNGTDTVDLSVNHTVFLFLLIVVIVIVGFF